MRVSLPVKFLVLALVGGFLPLELSLLYLLHAKEHERDEAFLRQGRMMADQVVIMRRWLSKQGGIYVRKQPYMRDEDHYLDNIETSTIDGDPLTLRSPFLVTREWSALADAEGLSRFRIVSLDPINPGNRPDPWEESALVSFEQGAVEVHTVSGSGEGSRYRYMVPLRTETDCHRCHVEHRYPIGGVRGGVSVDFPIGDILLQASRSNRDHILIAAALGLGLLALLGNMVRGQVLRPLAEINAAVSDLAVGRYDRPLAARHEDELGDLARTVAQVRVIVRDARQRLEEEVALRTGELERMRAHAQKERDYLINIFERMEDGVCVVRSDGHDVEYMNPSLRALMGEDGRRECCRTFFGEGAGGGPDVTVELASGGAVRREIAAPDGERTLEVLASELLDPDGSRILLFVFRDITERKRLEEALREMNRTLEAKVAAATAALLDQERMATLGEISGGLAHELRNPLSAILSGISLLESERRTGEERDHIIKLIRHEGARLNATLTDFLLFTRPREPKKVRIDLSGLVREICQMLRENVELSGRVEIQLDLADMPPVWFDDDQLRQLVWSIALNGIQAMSGAGRLEVRTRDLHNGRWTIEIQDSGPGIPPEIQKQIYDPFFSTKKAGTGLGLAIVRGIVAAHSASISAENIPGGGCRFTVTAPFGGPEG